MYDFEDLDYYALLGVPRHASSDEIKKAYRREIARYHPDRYAHAPAEEQAYAAARAQRINEANRTLSDFGSRSAYTRGLATSVTHSVGPTRDRATAERHASHPRRDRQAELYEQAQAQMAAGRNAQAASTLRQLQQLNPFYRDSAALLGRAEAALHQHRPPRRSARLMLGALLGLLVIGITLGILVGLQNNATIGTATTPTDAASAGLAFTATRTAEAVASREPVASPTAANVPSATVFSGATELVASALPTATRAPPSATSTPPASATTVATATAAAPTATVEVASSPVATATSIQPPATSAPSVAGVEDGQLLRSDDFSAIGRWATTSGPGWSVGYGNNTYRIESVAGIGDIWSYNAAPRASDISIGVDVDIVGDAAGLALRFADGTNYIAFLVDPAPGTYRIERVLGGGRSILSQGASAAINGDASNRLVAHLRDDSLQVYVNGNQVDTVQLRGVALADRFGLLASSSQNDTTAVFRNLEIRALP